MTKEFFDGEKRPILDWNWDAKEDDRVCKNCGQTFDKHLGYACPDVGVN